MSLNPVQFGSEVIDQFGRWLLTTFPIADEGLETQVREQLGHGVGGERLIAKGPYVYLNRPFEQGPSVKELAGEEQLGLHPALSGVFPYDSVHKHQELALRNVKQGRHTVVATGTGSGKTESFLLPVVDHCLHLRDDGADAGVVAILVYPMNALADDQLRRLRPMLAGTGITFGRYTGSTDPRGEPPRGRLAAPQHYSDEQLKLLEDGQEDRVPLPYEECWSREEIQARRPRILITNYSQLEFLLLRDKDLDLFRHAPLKFLVFDEVHTYTGALGSEVACLIRRLRRVARKSPTEVLSIGTSATVQDHSGKLDTQAATRNFASRLFGVSPESIALVQERYKRPTAPGSEAYVPAAVPDAQSLLNEILEETRLYRLKEEVDDISSETLRLAEVLCGRKAPAGPTAMLRAWHLMSENRIVRVLGDVFSRPRLLTEVLASLRPLERRDVDDDCLLAEVLCYLTLGTLLKRDEEPVLRPKFHYFVQGFQGLGCSFGEDEVPRLHFDLDGPVGESEPLPFPLVLCRSCGQHYVQVLADEMVRDGDLGVQRTRRPGRFEGPLESEGRVYFTNRLIGQAEDAGDGVKDAWVCRFCGTLHDGAVSTCRNPACRRKGLMYVQRLDGDMKKCAACGSYAKGYEEIVTSASSSEVADVTILSQTMLSAMEEEPLQKLLVFSDNRQDAAFQAGWMQERSQRFRLRHLLHEVLRSEQGKTWSLGRLTSTIVEKGQEHGIFKTNTWDMEEAETRVQWFLLQEFASPGQRRSSLESLGLAEVVYKGIGPDDAADLYRKWTATLGMDNRQLENLLRLLLDYYRRHQMVSHPLLAHQWSARDMAVRKGHVQVPDRFYPQALVWEKSAGTTSAFVKALKAGNNASGGQEIVRSGLPGADSVAPEVRNQFLEDVWAHFVQHEVLVPVELTRKWDGKVSPIPLPPEPHQINVDYLGIRVPSGHWLCSACRRSQNAPLPTGNCPEYRCGGSLEKTEVDPEHFDVYQYTRTRFVALKAAEHSAQVPAAQRRKYEEQFKRETGGRFNCLVCTPTLELGVDIGKLEMALMRNVPPTPANYAQRAGRAGRRHRIAVVFTYCRASTHDRYFYGSPADMIAGEIRVPAFSMQNEPLIRKHVHSAILTALREVVTEQERKTLDRAFPSFVDDYLLGEARGEDSAKRPWFTAPPDITLLADLCRRYEEDILVGLRTTFEETWPDEDRKDELLGEEALKRYVGGFAAELRRHVTKLFNQVKAYRDEIGRLNACSLERSLTDDEEADLRRHKAAVRALRDPSRLENYTLTYLSVDGFFPGYAMARQQVLCQSLEPYLALSRPAPVALREFTPANFVYANRNVYRPRKLELLRGGQGSRAEGVSSEQRLIYDRELERVIDAVGGQQEGGLSGNTETVVSLALRSVEMRNKSDINDTEKQRHRIAFQIVGQALFQHKGGRWGKRGAVEFRYLEGQRLRLVNLGIRRRGEEGYTQFPVCSQCGETRSPQNVDEYDRFLNGHKKLHGSDTVNRYALHVEFDSDTLHVGPFASKEHAVNLFEGLRIGARHLLDMGDTELEGFLYRSSSGQHWFAMYDPMPGGSGFLPLVLEYWDVLCDRARQALDRCTTGCDKACYSCMKHFRNQQWHDLLDRHEAMNLLSDLAHPLSLEHAIEPRTVEPQVNLDDTDSDSEVTFVDVCRNHGFPLPPESQFRVDLGNGEHTLADWAWPEHKLLIFIDGMTFHGDPVQASKDARKRTLCQFQGYTVIPITAQDLEDPTAMTMWFRLLRQAMGGE